jgi:L-serine dehydratase
MNLSIFDLYTIGIGPSSSHVVGPMRAARQFALSLEREHHLPSTASVRVELFGSLAFTGKGHGTDRAIMMGLSGESPESIDPDIIDGRMRDIRQSGTLHLLGTRLVSFRLPDALVFNLAEPLPFHSNGMRFRALDGSGNVIARHTAYSTGGGFVVFDGDPTESGEDNRRIPHPFTSGTELLRAGEESMKSIDGMVLENECTLRSEQEVHERLLLIWQAMQDCVARGLKREGILPGGLSIPRRAPSLYRELVEHPERALRDPLSILDWVNLYALAVNEENAAGGRVVTAPTNGAAGIIPAVLHYYSRFSSGADEEGVIRFLLTAGAIGLLYKTNASISGAEVGCQGEVGVACSMAAAGLTSALGGTNEQVENAAEIGMEHNLGLTCDPIGGLVQIPCIERNAMAAIKAINASRIALKGDGSHKVSLDHVIATMRQTGLDMKSTYKETSQGGLAVNVIEC